MAANGAAPSAKNRVASVGVVTNRLPPWFVVWEVSRHLLVVTDVAGLTFGSILKDQAVQE